MMLRTLFLAAAVFSSAVAMFAQPPTTERVAVPGGELVIDTAGKGETVLFLHGAFMDRRSWNRQMPAFAKGYRAVRYDIRPFGESSPVEQTYSPPDDVLRLLDHLKVRRAHLIGHSFGGGVALDFAVLHPERVASLTLAGVAPAGFAMPEDERKQAMAVFAAIKDGEEAIVKAWLGHPLWSVAVTRPDIRRELDEMTRRSLRVFQMKAPPYRLTEGTAERLGDVKVQTLVIVGDRDVKSLQQAADLFASRMPNVRKVIVAGADHALPMGWAAEFNEAVLKFLGDVGGNRAL